MSPAQLAEFLSIISKQRHTNILVQKLWKMCALPSCQRPLNAKQAEKIRQQLIEGVQRGEPFLRSLTIVPTSDGPIALDDFSIATHYLLDGQHRLEALLSISIRNKVNFKVPVDILHGPKNARQCIRLFHLLNDSKNIPKELLMRDSPEEEDQLICRLGQDKTHALCGKVYNAEEGQVYKDAAFVRNVQLRNILKSFPKLGLERVEAVIREKYSELATVWALGTRLAFTSGGAYLTLRFIEENKPKLTESLCCGIRFGLTQITKENSLTHNTLSKYDRFYDSFCREVLALEKQRDKEMKSK